MCGIVGFISDNKDKENIIKNMADRIKHRGPDGEGYYTDDMVALGHRRLSIIDIEGGSQPMYNNNGNLVIVFNGEIYNFLELKEELTDYDFKRRSDTEVILAGYEKWGKELPKKLRGMFAFAIWDKEKGELFCARDHFGIKPFYYYKKANTFAFASEIKSFLELPEFERVLNKEILGPYLSFSFTPTTETFFKDVFRLDPGCSLTVGGGEAMVERYFTPEYNEKAESFDEAVADIRKVMEDSVKHHLIADVEVGSFLSSGIDSSYLVSLAKPDKTYTVGYENKDYSEIEYAKDLTSKLGITNVSKLISREEYIDTLPKFFYHMDEPSSDPAAIALYFVAQLAAKDVKVVLSGEGADEFFGGYNTYREMIKPLKYNKIPFVFRKAASVLVSPLPDGRRRNFIYRNGRTIEQKYIGVNRIYGDKEKTKVLAFSDYLKDEDVTAKIFEQYKDKPDLTKMQAVDLYFWLVKDILQKADHMTMAHSLEGRVPFIDPEVFKAASGLKTEYRVNQENTKVALREASRAVIPNEAYKKKKLGFPVPLREWLRDDDLYNEVKNTFSQDFVAEFFNQDYIINLLNQHKNKEKDTYRKVWAVYAFIKWYEIFFLDRYSS